MTSIFGEGPFSRLSFQGPWRVFGCESEQPDRRASLAAKEPDDFSTMLMNTGPSFAGMTVF